MFENILGNTKIKEYLSLAIEKKQVSHSYLFVGIEGIGKRLIAKEFAKELLCLNEMNSNCVCKSCIEFQSSNHPDFYIIEPDGNNIKIEQIREMQRKVQEKPIISNKKIYIIDDADKMTKEAQNCLLKTLEEPPEFANIILIGSNESLLLETIRSRCVILHFKPIDNKELKSFIQNQYSDNNLDEDIIKMFQGSIGKAIKLKDQIDKYVQIGKVFKEIKQNDLIETIQTAKIIYESKDEIYSILDYINIILLDLSKSDYHYTNCIRIVEDTKERLKCNSNFDMCIDNMLFSIWGEVN